MGYLKLGHSHKTRLALTPSFLTQPLFGVALVQNREGVANDGKTINVRLANKNYNFRLN